MAKEGANILALDLAAQQDGVLYPSARRDDLEETQQLVEKEGQHVIIRQGGVRDLEAMRAFADEGIAELGRIDIVVANAGICTPRHGTTLRLQRSRRPSTSISSVSGTPPWPQHRRY